MKATVKEFTENSVTVEYEDGSVALVPITKGQDKVSIAVNVSQYNNPAEPYDKLADVPLTKGDVLEYDTSVTENPDVDYRDARVTHYPRWEKQMDAAYWARQGDDTQQKAVDAEILNVKTKIPKSWTGKQNDIAGLLD